VPALVNQKGHVSVNHFDISLPTEGLTFI